MVTLREVAKHSSKDSCWVILYGHVYDLTDFVDSHPGGADVILQYAGQDATDEFDQIHSKSLIQDSLPSSTSLGVLDLESSLEQQNPTPLQRTKQSKPQNDSPQLHQILNLDDFERVAEKFLPANGWAYYSSGSEGEVTKQLNREAYQRVLLRGRVMRNVEIIGTETKILGQKTSMPLFVCPAALAKLAHRDGECAITSAVGAAGLIQVVSSSSSMALEEIMAARVSADQTVFLQIYINPDIEKTKALIRKAELLGVKAIWITVDSAVMAKREPDERLKARIQSGEQSGSIKKGQQVQGIGRTLSRMLSASLTWEDLSWIRQTTTLPLVIKGIQCVEDAILAYENGVQGVVLSNHGGRSQDTSQAPLLTLLEIHKYVPHLLGKMEIYVDGGIRRGTDILKAVALGATAVGMGRPFLYSLSAGYGKAGVTRLIEVVRQELETNMALVGAATLQDLSPDMVNTKPLERDLVSLAKL